MNETPAPRLLVPARLAGQAAAWGLLGAALLVALVGLVVPAEMRALAWLGCGLAALVASAGVAAQAWLSSVPSRHPSAALRHFVGMAAVFLLLTLSVAVGCLWLHTAGVKFAGLAAFGVAFAATALVVHIVGVVVVANALQRRAHAAAAVQPPPRVIVCRAES